MKHENTPPLFVVSGIFLLPVKRSLIAIFYIHGSAAISSDIYALEFIRAILKMGQSLNQVIDETSQNRELEKVLELRKTEKAMQQKFKEKKSKLYVDALNDECIPIVCAVDTFYDFLVDIKKETLSVGIRSKIDKHLRGKCLEKLLILLEDVLKGLLDMETTAAPFEMEQTNVVYANKSVIRFDYYIYFESSVKGVEMSALFYFVQVGVIDMARARPQVLTYELTRATKGKKLKDAGSKIKKIADSTGDLNDVVHTLTMQGSSWRDPHDSQQQRGSPSKKKSKHLNCSRVSSL